MKSCAKTQPLEENQKGLAFMGEENSKMNMIFAKDRISRWIIDDFIDSKFLKLTEILIFKFLDFNYYKIIKL